MFDHVWEVAVLVHILYSHKKTRLLNILCIGYEYFKDHLIVYSDISYFDLTVALQTKKYKKKKKKEKREKKEKEEEEKEKEKKTEKSGIFTKCWKSSKRFCDALRNHGMVKHNIA